MGEQRLLRLPALLRRPPSPLLYLVYWLPFIAVYQVTNRYPVFEPRELPYTVLDEWIPFVPGLLPVYVAYLPFYWWTVARSEDDEVLNRIFYAAHFQLLLSAACFVLFPVRMPRELFYGPEVYGWADAFWRWFDAPNNCFPSLHVSTVLLLHEFNRRRPYARAHAAVGLAIIASTVLVKQHYAVDVVGGVLVFLATRRFLARLEIGERLTRAVHVPVEQRRSV